MDRDEIIFECSALKLTNESRAGVRGSSLHFRPCWLQLCRLHGQPVLYRFQQRPTFQEKPCEGLPLGRSCELHKKEVVLHRRYCLQVALAGRKWTVSCDDLPDVDRLHFLLQAQCRMPQTKLVDCLSVRPVRSRDTWRLGVQNQLCWLHVSRWGVTLLLQSSGVAVALWPLSCVKQLSALPQTAEVAELKLELDESVSTGAACLRLRCTPEAGEVLQQRFLCHWQQRQQEQGAPAAVRLREEQQLRAQLVTDTLTSSTRDVITAAKANWPGLSDIFAAAAELPASVKRSRAASLRDLRAVNSAPPLPPRGSPASVRRLPSETDGGYTRQLRSTAPHVISGSVASRGVSSEAYHNAEVTQSSESRGLWRSRAQLGGPSLSQAYGERSLLQRVPPTPPLDPPGNDYLPMSSDSAYMSMSNITQRSALPQPAVPHPTLPHPTATHRLPSPPVEEVYTAMSGLHTAHSPDLYGDFARRSSDYAHVDEKSMLNDVELRRGGSLPPLPPLPTLPTAVAEVTPQSDDASSAAVRPQLLTSGEAEHSTDCLLNSPLEPRSSSVSLSGTNSVDLPDTLCVDLPETSFVDMPNTSSPGLPDPRLNLTVVCDLGSSAAQDSSTQLLAANSWEDVRPSGSLPPLPARAADTLHVQDPFANLVRLSPAARAEEDVYARIDDLTLTPDPLVTTTSSSDVPRCLNSEESALDADEYLLPRLHVSLQRQSSADSRCSAGPQPPVPRGNRRHRRSGSFANVLDAVTSESVGSKRCWSLDELRGELSEHEYEVLPEPSDLENPVVSVTGRETPAGNIKDDWPHQQLSSKLSAERSKAWSAAANDGGRIVAGGIRLSPESKSYRRAPQQSLVFVQPARRTVYESNV